jgi:acyl-CoA synthetase (AMP-forming)/AMP-acid ligase II/acyl carrier protein
MITTDHERIGLVMRPGIDMVLSLLGVMAVAPVAPLVPSTPAHTLVQDLVRLRVSRIVIDENAPQAIKAAATQLGIPLHTLQPRRLKKSDAILLKQPDPNDIALLLQTSGTTSQPKVVPLSLQNLQASATNIVEALTLNDNDRSLAVMPLFHIHGLVASLLAPLMAGGSVICCQEIPADDLILLLPRLQPTWVSAVPTILQELLAALQRQGNLNHRHQLRFLRSSSSALSPSLLAQLEESFGCPVLEAYGMTEAAHQICSNRQPWHPISRSPGSVGQPAGPEVAILGADQQLLSAGQRGEVVIRGANVTSGYEDHHNSGWMTISDGEAWFPTGDEGYFDPQGRLLLTGRLKEMINRGGEKVIPRRVDEALLQHPAVEQALAFALPHPTLGEDLAAAVVLRAGTQADEEALRSHAFALLAPHEVPSLIVLLPDLPRGATGKLQRIGLADKLGTLLQPTDEPADGELEALVAHTFAAVLQQAAPGRNANFFQLGGDSLSGQRAVIALEQQLALELSPTLLFTYPTVRTMAEQLDKLLDQALAEAEEITS